ncbi:MAG: pyridoxal 5'-phosphate synthase glutaminase subunit PdxT [Candidatus Helarchaeota archaeon]
MKVGILGYQGDFRFHAEAVKKAARNLKKEIDVSIVRSKSEIEPLTGIIIPGGESTVMGSMMTQAKTFELLKNKIQNGMVVLGTCAGCIILAKNITDVNVGQVAQETLGVLDIHVERNSYGPQKESFEADLSIPCLGSEPFRATFIRAPVITNINPGTEILASFEEKPVFIKQNNVLAVTFHPELLDDVRLHEYFLKMIQA